MRAVRFHHRPARYLLTRYTSTRRPAFALGPFGCVSLDDVEPPPLPGPEWVRIETTLSGICGSDLAAITAHDSFTLEPFGAFPFTFGHENVGRVAEVGAGAAGWHVGERVIVNPMLACLQRGLESCPACERGEYGLCRRTDEGPIGGGPMIGFAPGAGGGWSRHFVAHRSQLHRTGDLDDETAVLADPLASALRPVLLHAPTADDTVLVIGAGTIGLLTVAALREIGWHGPIVVLGRHAFQLELARRAGASHALQSRDGAYDWAASLPGARSLKPTLAARFVEGGPSLIYDTVGSTGSVQDSLALAREGGRVVLVGGAAKVPTDWTRVWYRQLTIAGVLAYGPAPWNGAAADSYAAAIELLRRGAIGSLGLVTHRFGVTEYRAAIATAMDKRGRACTKVVLYPDD
jgi:L-iditol 2-dehydrogenase